MRPVGRMHGLFWTILLVGTQAACSSNGDDGGAGGDGGSSTSTSGIATTATGAGPGPTGSTSSATSGSGGAVADPPGVFVAVGSGGRRIRSTDDAMTWTDDVSIMESGGDDFVGLRTVAWGNGLFVAAGWRVMTSPDGVTWADTPPEDFNQNWMGQMSFGAGHYVGIGGYGSRVTSSNATSWEQHSVDTKASHGAGGIAYAEGKGFVSINDDGEISSSTDGMTWTYSSATVGANHAVAYGASHFVAVADDAVVRSEDGQSWEPPIAFAGHDIRALVFAQGHFTAITPEHAYTSDDGTVWEDHEVPGLFVYLAGFGHGTYVAFDVTRVRRSTDGLVWSDPQELGGTNDIAWVTFGPQP